MSDFDTTQPDPNEKPAAYCQNCGKPLTQTDVRQVGQSIFCEPCLDARVHGARTVNDSGYRPVNAGPGSSSGPSSAWPFTGTASPAGPAIPNPGLAFLLGLIPGVGAMYNEQYAKGIVHLTVFAFLVVLAHASGIFGLFIVGWVFYMAIEAHHTAQAKRDGLPLPNPFGLNDIGERMGFGSGWTTPQSVAGAARDAAQAAGFRPDPTQPAAPPPQPGAGAAGAAAWGAPADAYANPYASVPPPPPTYTPPYTEQEWQAHAHQSYSQNYPPPYGTPMPPYTAPFPPPIIPPTSRNRFPVGAVWLIALGTLFLLGTEGIFRGLRGEVLVGILFLAFAVTLFVRRMTAFGGSIENDGTSAYQFRLLYALKPSVWMLLIGVLFLLDSFNILYWDHSWPLFLILAGVMMLLGRAVTTMPPPYHPASAPVTAPGSDMTRLNLNPNPPSSSSDTHTGGN